MLLLLLLLLCFAFSLRRGQLSETMENRRKEEMNHDLLSRTELLEKSNLNFHQDLQILQQENQTLSITITRQVTMCCCCFVFKLNRFACTNKSLSARVYTLSKHSDLFRLFLKPTTRSGEHAGVRVVFQCKLPGCSSFTSFNLKFTFISALIYRRFVRKACSTQKRANN